MSRPRLLDLYCGAGGAGVGYSRAGFEVVGVDHRPQPSYPFEFVLADALGVLAERPDWARSFDAIHASPPCQAETTMSVKHRGAGTIADSRVSMIQATRAQLETLGRPFVIENVPGSRRLMGDYFVTLNGGQFGLRVDRPRHFETNWFVLVPPRVLPPRDAIGVYGRLADGRWLWVRNDGSTLRAPASVAEAGEAMGIDWIGSWPEMREAIPPAYTEYLGGFLAELVADRPRGRA